jgi:hypothetical protein
MPLVPESIDLPEPGERDDVEPAAASHRQDE